MELLKKYPKLFQWFFLLVVFFFLCFAIDVPETYKFIRGQAEFIKDPNQSTYTLFGAEVRYYAFDVFWRLPPLLGWVPIWINDALFFLMNECLPNTHLPKQFYFHDKLPVGPTGKLYRRGLLD